MKTHVIFLKAAFVCLGVFLYLGLVEAERVDWKILRQDSYGQKFAYDAASVKQTTSNTMTVWTKSDGAKYLCEIDCKNRKARLLEGLGAGAEWFVIAGGSDDELLFKAVCP